MPQDAYNLRYLCIELNDMFKGGKINRIVQPTEEQVVFTVWTGKDTKKLLLDVNPAMPRISVCESEKKAPLSPLNFCMLLRKHLQNATINSIELVGFDRIVKIDLTASDEFFDGVDKTIYVELMGRYSNVILTENDIVLGGNRGINFFDNGVRPLIVNKKYSLPPANGKKEPSDISLIDDFKAIDSEALLCESLASLVQGLAKATADEIVLSFLLKKGQKVAEMPINTINCKAILGLEEDLFEHLNEFIYGKKVCPTVYLLDEEVKDVGVIDYSLYPFERKRFSYLWQAEEFYFENKIYAKEFKNKKERLKSVVNTNIKKVSKRLSAIKMKKKDAQKAEENKLFGELIFSNIYRLKGGEKMLIADNYYEDNCKVQIPLDENLSPQKNAENYYKKYTKQKRTISALLPQEEQAENDIKYLESVLEEIDIAENIVDLDCTKEELESIGLIKVQKKGQKMQKEKPFRNYRFGGFNIKVGRNNLENDMLTGGAKQEYMWLHSKDHHSSHVIIEGDGNYSLDVITIAGEICAYYSKARQGGKSEVVYTLKKKVKKPKGGKLGFFTYTEYNSILVEANKREEFLV